MDDEYLPKGIEGIIKDVKITKLPRFLDERGFVARFMSGDENHPFIPDIPYVPYIWGVKHC